MNFKKVSFSFFLLIFSSQAMAYESICQFTVYEGKFKVGTRTIGVGLGTISLDGFTFTAVPQNESNVEMPPVALRITKAGYTATSLMTGKMGGVKFNDPAGFTAVAKCERDKVLDPRTLKL